MGHKGQKSGFEPAGFLVLRTPLLPWDEYRRWGAGLTAPVTADGGALLETACASDRITLRERLREIVLRPEVSEALFLASPRLFGALDTWMQDPDSGYGHKIETALVRYFSRMVGRATPFGLFAGCSVGTLERETRMRLLARSEYRRYTRLGMSYLGALCHALERDPALRAQFKYRPNSSIYRYAGRIRFAEETQGDPNRIYHLVAVNADDYVEETLSHAKDGAAPLDLAKTLAADGSVFIEEAQEFVDDLIENQLLVSELSPPITGSPPVRYILQRLNCHESAAEASQCLEQTTVELEALDAHGIGVNPEAYLSVARHLEGLSVPVNMSTLFQVDMIKPANITLPPLIVKQIERGVEILHRLARTPGRDPFENFRESFLKRYGHREVPLVEALDGELGIGFSFSDRTDPTPLLVGLPFPPAPLPGVAWDKRDGLLASMLVDAAARGAQVIELSQSDVEALANPVSYPLPDAFSVMASVASSSEAALARGDFQLLIHSGSGPSGARLLARFCHADQTLHEHVLQHLRAEQALRPEALFAEIVHWPEGHLGNVIVRPILREYEIPYLGVSGAPGSQQIPITDLLVSVQGERIRLRSARMGREIIPRLTSAHNFTRRSTPIYRFLCSLQGQGVIPGLFWDWGALRSLPFLPRVVSGRLVLRRAQWNIGRQELGTWGQTCGACRFAEVQAWRQGRRVPRLVYLADGDNELPVDFDNLLSVETFVELVKSRDSATLVEMFPEPEQLCVQGPEGSYVHELIIPFVRVQSSLPPAPERTKPPELRAIKRSLSPESEWLYLKFYTGTATADHVLRDLVRPLTRAVLDAGLADSWFFIRYGDPDWHIRLRLHSVSRRMHAEVIELLHTMLPPWLMQGRIWRVQIDTYEREVERYGGRDGIELAERIFHADSEAVLSIIAGHEGFSETGLRWRLAVCGMDMMLNDLGLRMETKAAFAEHRQESFAREFRVNSAFWKQVSRKFANERTTLQSLLYSDEELDGETAPGLAALRKRSVVLVPLFNEINRLVATGDVVQPLEELAASYIHMHVNRLLPSAHREQELVLYAFLARLYRAMLARGTKGK